MEKYILKDNFLKFLAFYSGLFTILPFKLKPTIVIFYLIYLLFYRPKYNLNKFSIFLLSYLVIYTLSLSNTFNGFKTSFDLFIRLIPFLIIPYFLSSLTKIEFDSFKIKALKVLFYSSLLYGISIIIYLYSLGSLTNIET